MIKGRGIQIHLNAQLYQHLECNRIQFKPYYRGLSSWETFFSDPNFVGVASIIHLSISIF